MTLRTAMRLEAPKNANPMKSKTVAIHLLAESHRRQFAGEDFQAVAISIAEREGIAFEDDAYTDLQVGPDTDCECGFCKTADWSDCHN